VKDGVRRIRGSLRIRLEVPIDYSADAVEVYFKKAGDYSKI